MTYDGGGNRRERFVLVAGLKSNLRGILSDAIHVGRKHGYEVHILDISRLVEGWAIYPNEWDELGLEVHVSAPRTRDELSDFLAADVRTSTPFLFLFLPERRARKIWYAIQRKSKVVGVITVGPVPQYREYDAPSAFMRVRSALAGIRMGLSTVVKPTPRFWIVAGTSCVKLYRQYFRSVAPTTWIWAHTLDYEIHRRMSEVLDDHLASSNRNSYIAFLDQGWFSKLPAAAVDPRTTGGGRYPPVEYESYKRQIARFLRELSAQTSYEVIVCAHPKSDEAHTRSLYEGFEIQRGQSAALVKNAEFVVAHSTTSIQYAVLERKPVLLFTNRELKDSIMQPPFLGYQKSLNLPVVDIETMDNVAPALANLRVDGAAYDKFEHEFIKSRDSCKDGLWNLVFQQIRQISS